MFQRDQKNSLMIDYFIFSGTQRRHLKTTDVKQFVFCTFLMLIRAVLTFPASNADSSRRFSMVRKIDSEDEINRTHKRALRILFKDYDSSFDNLLEKSERVKIHVLYLQKLMIEIYITMNNLNLSYI